MCLILSEAAKKAAQEAAEKAREEREARKLKAAIWAEQGGVPDSQTEASDTD